MIFKEHR